MSLCLLSLVSVSFKVLLIQTFSSNQSPPKLNHSSLISLKSFTDELAADMPICRPHTQS
ncbi:hypothetical protein HanRHA438_Chr17g0800331 [Helianthus annuus]|nr:hypothetical protein HanRHA438_Chr17g0800331 [Helianthus annuus]